MLPYFTHPKAGEAFPEQWLSRNKINKSKCVLLLLGPLVPPVAAASPPSQPWGNRWQTVGAAAPFQSGYTSRSKTWKDTEPCDTPCRNRYISVSGLFQTVPQSLTITKCQVQAQESHSLKVITSCWCFHFLLGSVNSWRVYMYREYTRRHIIHTYF